MVWQASEPRTFRICSSWKDCALGCARRRSCEKRSPPAPPSSPPSPPMGTVSVPRCASASAAPMLMYCLPGSRLAPFTRVAAACSSDAYVRSRAAAPPTAAACRFRSESLSCALKASGGRASGPKPSTRASRRTCSGSAPAKRQHTPPPIECPSSDTAGCSPSPLAPPLAPASVSSHPRASNASNAAYACSTCEYSPCTCVWGERPCPGRSSATTRQPPAASAGASSCQVLALSIQPCSARTRRVASGSPQASAERRAPDRQLIESSLLLGGAAADEHARATPSSASLIGAQGAATLSTQH
mmetsp:Transcript_34914/g.87095  ORF Transcript_34914/g.87095 Transcript_34914/m.87095 type:complete len:301 (-) Transcript_34914:64-966(-)